MIEPHVLTYFHTKPSPFPLSFVLSETNLVPFLKDDELFLCVECVDFVIRSSFHVGPDGCVAPPPGTLGDGDCSSTGSVSSNSNSQTPRATPIKNKGATAVSISGSTTNKTAGTCVQDFILRVLTLPDEVKDKNQATMSQSELSDYINSAGGLNVACEKSLSILRVVKPRSTVKLLLPAQKTRLFPGTSGRNLTCSTNISSLNERILLNELENKKLSFDDCLRLPYRGNSKVELVFSTGEDDVLNDTTGLVWLSSDVQPDNTEASLFWWPSQSAESSSEILFPLRLDDSSRQPLGRYLLSTLHPGNEIGTFILPLYLYSATSGAVNLKIKLEYFQKLKVCHIPLRVLFVKPLDALFDIEHAGDTWTDMYTEQVTNGTDEVSIKFKSPSKSINDAGRHKSGQDASTREEDAKSGKMYNHTVLREGDKRASNAPIVLCDDTLSISTTLTCLEDLGEGIEILSLTLIDGHQSEDKALNDAPVTPASTTDHRLFRIMGFKNAPENGNSDSTRQEVDLIDTDQCSSIKAYGSDGDEDLVQDGDEGYNLMRKDERLHGAVDVLCLPLTQQGQSYQQSLSMTLDKINSSNIEKNSSEYVIPSTKATIGYVKVQWRCKDSATNGPNETTGLPKLVPTVSIDDSEAKDTSSKADCLDLSVSRSYLNETIFQIPPVTLVEPPLTLVWQSPLLCLLDSKLQ